MSHYYCVCTDLTCAQTGCKRVRGTGLYEFVNLGSEKPAPAHGNPFVGPCPPASEDTLRVALAGAVSERDAWKAKYDKMKKAFNAADTLCFEVELALDGKPVPHDKDDLLDRVVALRAECERLRSILPPERERHRGVGEGSWAVFAERMLAERDAAREELAALRAQLATNSVRRIDG